MLFPTTIFLNAFLLFLLQPIVARMLLPSLGGAPAVWNVCMLFFQTLLLFGYLYADRAISGWGVHGQSRRHLLPMLAVLPFLPFALPGRLAGELVHAPISGLLHVLLVGIGLPFFVLAAGSPMLQRWFSVHPSRRETDPYRLSMAGNAGSLIALLAYPLIIERVFPLAAQAQIWSVGYLLLFAMTAACAFHLPRDLAVEVNMNADQPSVGDASELPAIPLTVKKSVEGAIEEEPGPTYRQALCWVGLAFIPSSLFLGITTYISTDIAAIPLLWILPLSLYLASFIIVFSRTYESLHARLVEGTAAILSPMPLLLLFRFSLPLGVLVVCHLCFGFILFLIFHGELALKRPASQHLTAYYLWMSVGGALGGVFNSLLAPLLFTTSAEYQLTLALAAFFMPLVPARLSCSSVNSGLCSNLDKTSMHRANDASLHAMASGSSELQTAYPSWRRLVRHASLCLIFVCFWWFEADFRVANETSVKTAIASLLTGIWIIGLVLPRFFRIALPILLIAGIWFSFDGREVLYRERSFFGVHTVQRDTDTNVHLLKHGNIHHGWQSPASSSRGIPLAYYARSGPAGRIFREMRRRYSDTNNPARVALLGLGTGALVSYGTPGQIFDIFEIDETVSRIAQNPDYFSYLSDSSASISVHIVDGRMGLASAHGVYDLIVLDAYSSDAIPLHLTTVEALRIYLDRLASDGLLAFHISNRYFDLEPVLGELAIEAKLVSRICIWQLPAKLPPDEENLRPYVNPSNWVVLARSTKALGSLADDPAWEPCRLIPGTTVWRDDFINLLGALKR
ncbi:MAG: hypothetical protein HQM09_15550 [Candidatus Riflebacteria bacterium]|nr:hypothetical protein [Candidatus Riflebacteria bacterium]